MIYVPTSLLKPNMIVARDIAAYGSVFSLVVSGQRLTTEVIRRLQNSDVGGVYIESGLASDIAPTEILDPGYKKKVITDMKGIFGDVDRTGVLTDRAVSESAKMAEDLVVTILNQDVFLVDVITIKDYDNYTYSHSLCVAMLSVLIGMQLKYSKSKLDELALCGLMHDIGKVDIPLDIINKTGKLSSEEMDVMRTHPLRSVERLRHNRKFTQRVFNGISCHHERYDGKGYPFGLAQDKIHVYARILALADVYDALTSDRSYRRAWAPAEAIEYMMAQSGTHFDFSLLQCFLRTVAAYPLGFLVRLSNDCIGIVVKNYSENTLRPRVRLIVDNGEFKRGDELDLCLDQKYLNVVVSGTLTSEEIDRLPPNVLDAGQLKQAMPRSQKSVM